MGFSLFLGVATKAPVQPVAPALPSYTVTLTAYNAVPEQTDGDPHITASGAFSNPEIIAARSVDLVDELPFGTIIELTAPTSDPKNTCGYEVVEPIIGYRVIADAMNPRYTERIDVLFGTDANYIMTNGRTKNAGTILGICSGVGIRVVGYVDPRRMPKTQADLAALVHPRAAKEVALKQ